MYIYIFFKFMKNHVKINKHLILSQILTDVNHTKNINFFLTYKQKVK